MLQQVLRELESARGPVNLNELADKLGLERSALEGMIAFWVRKGRLTDSQLQPDSAGTCGGCSCATSCAKQSSCCTMTTQMPRRFSLLPK